MPRNTAVREEALERDERKCQISGAGGAEWKGVVQVDHWRWSARCTSSEDQSP